MSLATKIHSEIALQLRKPLGWVGIDIGSGATKLAQIEHRRNGYRFSRRWHIPHDSLSSDSADEMAPGLEAGLGEIASAARELGRMFSQRQSAAAISLAYQDLRSLELPTASDNEMRDMIREEITGERDELAKRCFDFWSVPLGHDDGAHVTVVAVDANRATTVARRLLGCGFECQILDAIPCALARAMQMADADNDQPQIAIDLGNSTCTYVLVEDGIPIFTRILRGGGLHSMTEALRTSMRISPPEAAQILRRCDMVGGETGPSHVHSTAARLLEQPLKAMLGELTKTFEYTSHKFAAYRPTQIRLFGGGATIRNLPEIIEGRLQIPTARWSLQKATDQSADDDAQFGVAAGLSVLRWESM
jgi:Tfp pilus assembly PilM family ATPase